MKTVKEFLTLFLKLRECKTAIKKAEAVMTQLDEPNRFSQACGFYEDAIAYGDGVIEDSKQAENIFKYARFLHINNQFTEALSYYNKSLDIRRALVVTNPELYNPDMAKTLNNLGILYEHGIMDYLKAEEFYSEARNTYLWCCDNLLTDLYMPKLYNATINLSYAIEAQGRKDEAVELRKLIGE